MLKNSLFALSALTLAVSVAYAQPASAPAVRQAEVAAARVQAPLVDYLRLPQYAGPTLSPDGRYIAVSTPVNGRLNLAVVDMETRKGTALTNFSDYDVVSVTWVGNERLVFTLGQFNAPTGPGQSDGGGLFMVSRDGKDSRQLAKSSREAGTRNEIYRSMQVLSRIPGNGDEIIVEANIRSEDALDVYKLDLRNGRTSLISGNRPARTTGWVLDNSRLPRVATSSVKDSLVTITHYRASADAPWKEIARTDESTGKAFAVLGFLADDKTLLVASNEGRDTMAVFKYDPETGKLGELIAQHPRYDMGADAQGESVPGVITEPDTDRLIGYTVDAEKPVTVWIDEKEARTQATVDAALPGLRNAFRRFPNSSRLLVTSYSDVVPAKYYLLDEQKRTLEELFDSKPWLGKEQLVEMRPFLLKTRDGLEIPSYYFLPKGYKPGDKLPTVVHIHGGPFARADHWGRGFGYQEAELLASRGYAVILPNYRVTPGFGAKIYQAGFGTIGTKMSEDHEDAVQWGIAQGFVDPARVCISGASYGGYAVMRALAKTPEMFKCGISGHMVSDYEMQLTSLRGDTARNEAGVTYWKKVLGQSDTNKTAMRDASSVFMAAKIKAPVFIYGGADDIRTPMEQTYAMVNALEKAGNPPKVVLVKDKEGHGYGKLENNLDLYEKMLKFLDEQIGTKPR